MGTQALVLGAIVLGPIAVFIAIQGYIDFGPTLRRLLGIDDDGDA